MTDPAAERRRSRRRRARSNRAGAAGPAASAGSGADLAPRPDPAADTADSAVNGQVAPATPAETPGRSPRVRSTRARAERNGSGNPRDRGLRDLVGAGPTQVTTERALRARDLNRPTDEDLAEAEAEVTLVHRHWKPRG